jgi:hypothetical protein
MILYQVVLIRVCSDTAYHFASATTLLLGCALKAPSDEVAQDCVAKSQETIKHLRNIKNATGWDLADVCLSQCETATHRMGDGTFLDFRRQRTARPSRPNISPPSTSVDGPRAAHARTARGDEVDSSFSRSTNVHRDTTPDGLFDTRETQFDFGTHEFSGMYGLDTMPGDQWHEMNDYLEPNLWEFPGSVDEQLKF